MDLATKQARDHHRRAHDEGRINADGTSQGYRGGAGYKKRAREEYEAKEGEGSERGVAGARARAWRKVGKLGGAHDWSTKLARRPTRDAEGLDSSVIVIR